MFTRQRCLVGHYLHDAVDLLYEDFHRPNWQVSDTSLPLADIVQQVPVSESKRALRAYELMTQLREPKARLSSLYAFWVGMHTKKSVTGHSFSEFIQSRKLDVPMRKDNYYVRVFCPEVHTHFAADCAKSQGSYHPSSPNVVHHSCRVFETC
jgi:hypothetical protein